MPIVGPVNGVITDVTLPPPRIQDPAQWAVEGDRTEERVPDPP